MASRRSNSNLAEGRCLLDLLHKLLKGVALLRSHLVEIQLQLLHPHLQELRLGRVEELLRRKFDAGLELLV